MTSTFTERAGGTAHWLEVAENLAAVLAGDAAARDAAGSAPTAEVSLLRESGLLGLLVPEERGTTGEGWFWGGASNPAITVSSSPRTAAW